MDSGFFLCILTINFARTSEKFVSRLIFEVDPGNDNPFVSGVPVPANICCSHYKLLMSLLLCWLAMTLYNQCGLDSSLIPPSNLGCVLVSLTLTLPLFQCQIYSVVVSLFVVPFNIWQPMPRIHSLPCCCLLFLFFQSVSNFALDCHALIDYSTCLSSPTTQLMLMMIQKLPGNFAAQPYVAFCACRCAEPALPPFVAMLA